MSGFAWHPQVIPDIDCPMNRPMDRLKKYRIRTSAKWIIAPSGCAKPKGLEGARRKGSLSAARHAVHSVRDDMPERAERKPHLFVTAAKHRLKYFGNARTRR